MTVSDQSTGVKKRKKEGKFRMEALRPRAFSVVLTRLEFLPY